MLLAPETADFYSFHFSLSQFPAAPLRRVALSLLLATIAPLMGFS
jgi:hypothetical protein